MGSLTLDLSVTMKKEKVWVKQFGYIEKNIAINSQKILDNAFKKLKTYEKKGQIKDLILNQSGDVVTITWKTVTSDGKII